ncbi:hypothetical protein [Pontibacter kalidii]|uniref:hypothetical protein n=1 Tax=Pontibacter kalidii TaxID=2592049 RepID=UPI00224DAB95|nr:hypothetical protein [Pontibacter kalidii]
MKKHIIHLCKTFLVLLPLACWGCQGNTEQDEGLAATHPELARDLAKDSLTVPYSDSTSEQLYNRYRITTEEYRSSGNYSVGNMYRGRLAPLDETSHTDARSFRTAIRKGMEEGVNFAGKYTVVSIGCGTGCQQHYVVDRETGKVLDKVQSSMGASYSADSRLLIVNPPDSAVNYEGCNQCTPEAYVFENDKFRKLQQQ